MRAFQGELAASLTRQAAEQKLVREGNQQNEVSDHTMANDSKKAYRHAWSISSDGSRERVDLSGKKAG